MFGSTDFSLDLQPRTQSVVNSDRDSKNYGNMFEQSVFTMEVPDEPKAAEPLVISYFREAGGDEELREFTQLQEALRVESDSENPSEKIEVPLSVENVTFAQMLSMDTLGSMEMDNFLSKGMESSKELVIGDLRKSQAPSMSVALSMTQNHTFSNSFMEPRPSAVSLRPTGSGPHVNVAQHVEKSSHGS